MHLPYIQTGKLKQNRGCKTPKTESVAEPQVEAICLIAKLFKHCNLKDRHHVTIHLFHTPFLQKACTDKSYGNTLYWMCNNVL